MKQQRTINFNKIDKYIFKKSLCSCFIYILIVLTVLESLYPLIYIALLGLKTTFIILRTTFSIPITTFSILKTTFSILKTTLLIPKATFSIPTSCKNDFYYPLFFNNDTLNKTSFYVYFNGGRI